MALRIASRDTLLKITFCEIYKGILKNTSKMKWLKFLIIFLLLLSLNISVAQEKKVLIIDAGHGGTDLGAIGANHIKEKDITLAIAKAIHATNKRATGIEIYLHSNTSLQTENQKKSSGFALSMIEELTDRLGYRNRGLKTANFQVLRESIHTSPAILVELGFLSNVDEAKYLELKKNTNALALAILMSIKIKDYEGFIY